MNSFVSFWDKITDILPLLIPFGILILFFILLTIFKGGNDK